MKPVPESRGQSNIAPVRYDSDRQLSVQSAKWLIAALIIVSEWCFSSDEQQFGRLFTTPEQRQRLQELREEHRRTSGSRKGTGTETGEMTGRYHAEQSKAECPAGRMSRLSSPSRA